MVRGHKFEISPREFNLLPQGPLLHYDPADVEL